MDITQCEIQTKERQKEYKDKKDITTWWNVVIVSHFLSDNTFIRVENGVSQVSMRFDTKQLDIQILKLGNEMNEKEKWGWGI